MRGMDVFGGEEHEEMKGFLQDVWVNGRVVGEGVMKE